MEPKQDPAAPGGSTLPSDRVDALRDYAWKYFQFHADQRLKTFNFFVLFATVLIGGGLTLLKDETIPRAGIAVGFFLLAFFAFVFWKLDQRNKDLIRHGEAALKHIEQMPYAAGAPDEITQIFSSEERATTKHRSTTPHYKILIRRFSFSENFALVFATIGAIGIALGVATSLGLGSADHNAPVVAHTPTVFPAEALATPTSASPTTAPASVIPSPP